MRNIKKQLKEETGFTLVEMMIVLFIISVLLILVVTNLGGVNDRITVTKTKGANQIVESQMMIYEMEHGNKPTLDVLETKGYITKEQREAYKPTSGQNES